MCSDNNRRVNGEDFSRTRWDRKSITTREGSPLIKLWTESTRESLLKKARHHQLQGSQSRTEDCSERSRNAVSRWSKNKKLEKKKDLAEAACLKAIHLMIWETPGLSLATLPKKQKKNGERKSTSHASGESLKGARFKRCQRWGNLIAPTGVGGLTGKPKRANRRRWLRGLQSSTSLTEISSREKNRKISKVRKGSSE